MAKRPKVKIGGDASAAVREVARLEQQVEKLQKKLKDSAEASKRMTTDGTKGFSLMGRAVVDVGHLAAKGWELARQALTKYEDEAEKAVNRTRELMGARAKLAQVASKERPYETILADAESTAAESGMDPVQAHGLQFLLESKGLQQHRKMLASTYPIVERPSDVARGAEKLQAIFGKAETGGFEGTVGKLIAAAAPSGLSAGEIAPTAAMFAQQFKRLGASDEETLASISVAEGMAGTVSKGVTGLQAFGTSMLRPNVLKRFRAHGVTIGNDGALAAAQAIQRAGLTNQELMDAFGRVEAFEGYGYLTSGSSQISALAGELTQIQAGARDPVAELTGRGKAESRVALPRLEKAVDNMATQSEEASMGPREQLQDIALGLVRTATADKSWIHRWTLQGYANWSDTFDQDPGIVAGHASQMIEERAKRDPEFAAAVKEFERLLADYRQSTKAQERAANKTGGGPGLASKDDVTGRNVGLGKD